MSRSKRRTIAKETIQVIENGYYTSASGARVSIQPAQDDAVKGSVLYRPEDFGGVHSEAKRILNARADAPLNKLEIEEATTFAEAKTR